MDGHEHGTGAPVWDLMIHLSLALLPIEFRLVAEPGLDSYTLLRRINY